MTSLSLPCFLRVPPVPTLISRMFPFCLDLCHKDVNFCLDLCLMGVNFGFDLCLKGVNCCFDLCLKCFTLVMTSVSRVYIDLDLVSRA
jgi:hypothetical protein